MHFIAHDLALFLAGASFGGFTTAGALAYRVLTRAQDARGGK